MKTLPGNAREVKDLAFSPDGRLIATLGIDNGNKGELKLWDLEKGKDIFSYTGDLFLFLTTEAAMTTFSPDGKYLAACGKGGIRRGNDAVKNGAVQHTGLFKVWEVSSGKEVSLADAPGWATSCVFSPDSRSLAVLGGDGTARVLDVATGKEEMNVPGWGAEIPYREALAFSPDGQQLAVAGGYTVRVWDRQRKAQVLDLRGHSSAVVAVAFSPDGRRLASGGADNLVRLWDLDEVRRPRFLRDESNAIDGRIAFSPDGELLVTSGHALSGNVVRHIKVWKTAGGELVRTLHRPEEEGKPRPVGTFDGSSAHVIRCFALSPVGKRVATGEAQGVTLWDVAGGARLRSVTVHNATRERPSSAGVNDVAFSPDGKHVASTGGDGTVQVWNADDGKAIFEWVEERSLPNVPGKVRTPGWSVALSGDGKRLAAGFPDRCRVFDVVTRRPLCTIDRPGPVTLNPAGTLVLTYGQRPEIGVWDAADGKHLFDLKGHFAAVTGLAFTPDGSRLASASADGTVKLWDLTTRREVLTLRGPQGVALGVAFSADGNRLASAHSLFTGKIGLGPGEVRIWDARPLTPPAPAPARR